MNSKNLRKGDQADPNGQLTTSQSIDWYSAGDFRLIEFGGIKLTVRIVGRKGRRTRISITGPAGAVFRAAKVG